MAHDFLLTLIFLALKSSHFVSILKHLTLTFAMLQGEHSIRKVEKKKKAAAANAVFHFHRDIFTSSFPGKNRDSQGRTIKCLKLPCFHEECHSLSLRQRFYSYQSQILRVCFLARWHSRMHSVLQGNSVIAHAVTQSTLDLIKNIWAFLSFSLTKGV